MAESKQHKINRLEDEISRLKEQIANRECVADSKGYCGYSQETMNALVRERDGLIAKIKEMCFQEKESKVERENLLNEINSLILDNSVLTKACDDKDEALKILGDKLKAKEDENKELKIEKYMLAVPLYMRGMLERGEIEKEKLDKWFEQALKGESNERID